LENAEFSALRGWFTIQEVSQSASSILEEGWRFEKFEPILVTHIQDWGHYGAEDRSWGFHLHAWEFMDPLLREYDDTGETIWLDAAVQVAVKWIEAHRGTDNSNDLMAWYDMSLSLRTPRLIAITFAPHVRDTLMTK